LAKDPVSDELMIRYLLGGVSDEEQARLEEHYFVDDSIFAQLSALEDELIDDYVRGDLTEPQRKQFALHFLNSAERRRKLAFAESLTRYLSTAPTVAEVGKEETWRQKMADWFGLRGTTLRWAVATAFAAVLLGAAWLVRENWRLHIQLQKMQAQQTERQQREDQLSKQLAQLKVPAIEGTPGGAPAQEGAQSRPGSLPIVALTLFPGVLRSDAEQKTLVISPGPHLVRLQLDLENQTYDRYLATLETAEGRRIWLKEDLKSTPDTGGHTLVLELPSALLGNNDYILKLRGIRSGGAPTNQYPGETQRLVAEEIAAYNFRVVKH